MNLLDWINWLPGKQAAEELSCRARVVSDDYGLGRIIVEIPAKWQQDYRLFRRSGKMSITVQFIGRQSACNGRASYPRPNLLDQVFFIHIDVPMRAEQLRGFDWQLHFWKPNHEAIVVRPRHSQITL